MIDRNTPLRPPGPLAGWQRWRSLLFMHWAVPVEALRSVVPRELVLDLHDGVAYVGIVPFAMEGIRPRWWPEALALRFLETNVRTYVLHDGRPGVYFFSLEANSRTAVTAARMGWSLPYHYARMSMTSGVEEIEFHSRRARPDLAHRVRYGIREALVPVSPGSVEHFLIERYRLFVKRGSRILTGQVCHVPYPLHRAEVHEVWDELAAAAGIPGVQGPPVLAHYSPGVDVEVFPLT